MILEGQFCRIYVKHIVKKSQIFRPFVKKEKGKRKKEETLIEEKGDMTPHFEEA